MVDNNGNLLEDLGDEDDIIRISPLKELSRELISENIKFQIDNPFISRNNFLEEFVDQYNEESDEREGNDDATKELDETARDFFLKIIEMIDHKFDLGIDFDAIGAVNCKGVASLAEGLYEFFIIKYPKNISKYITMLTLEYKSDLIDSIASDDDKDTVAYASLAKKLNSAEDGILITNINRVFDALKTLDIDNDTFIDYFNEDKYEVAITKYCIENFIITNNFVSKYLDPVFGINVQDDIYDDVVGTVRHNLYTKFKKDVAPTLDDYREGE